MSNFQIQLSIIAARSRWAFYDAVYDCKMIEANRLCSGGTTCIFRYLKERYGSGKAVLKLLLDELSVCGKKIPITGDKQAVLNYIAKHHIWLLDDVLITNKEEEAMTIMNGSLNGMLKYLVSAYGSLEVVTASLHQIVRHGHLKSLHLLPHLSGC